MQFYILLISAMVPIIIYFRVDDHTLYTLYKDNSLILIVNFNVKIHNKHLYKFINIIIYTLCDK